MTDDQRQPDGPYDAYGDSERMEPWRLEETSGDRPPHDEVEVLEAEPVPKPAPPVRSFRPRRRLAFWLFVATCVSTVLSGMVAGLGMPDPVWLLQTQPREVIVRLLWNGVCYAGPLMLILLAHEMGHYLQARRYGVPATLPYFIPMPFSPFGTMGAVILQGAGVADRKALFDIAISGPLAGLVLALPVAYYGLLGTQVVQVDPNEAAIRYGDPLVLRWMAEWIHGPLAENEDVLLTPMLFAGWVGIFITALNLIPIGQLDGGHVLYALIGRRAHTVALGIVALAVGFMFVTGDYSYSLMVILLLLIGVRHPPTANDFAPLGPLRVVLGWLTLAFVVVGFTPTPIIFTPGEAQPRQQQQQRPKVPPPDPDNPIIWTQADPSQTDVGPHGDALPVSDGGSWEANEVSWEANDVEPRGLVARDSRRVNSRRVTGGLNWDTRGVERRRRLSSERPTGAAWPRATAASATGRSPAPCRPAVARPPTATS